VTRAGRWGGMVSRVLAAAWLAALLSPEASASEVVDVRLGDHPGYSRVVIELDRPAGYTLKRNAAQGEFTLSVDASARPKTLSLPSGVVASIDVQPSEQGARARIRLREKQVRVRQRLFSEPPRIVLDFRAGAPDEAGAGQGASPAPPTAKAPPHPSKPESPEAGAGMEEPLAEAELVPPVEAAPPDTPSPAAPEAEGTDWSSMLMALLIGGGAGVALAIVVLWLMPRPERELPSPASIPELRESAAAAPEAPKPVSRRPAVSERPKPLPTPPPGIRDTGTTRAGAESVDERIRRLEEQDGKAPSSDAPRTGTTMTGMTRER
jgi:hypothetical protein